MSPAMLKSLVFVKENIKKSHAAIEKEEASQV